MPVLLARWKPDDVTGMDLFDRSTLALHAAAIDESEALLATGDPTARWIARDALRELRNPATIARIRR